MPQDLNLIDYYIARELHVADLPFSALLAAAMMKADSVNSVVLRNGFPKLHATLQDRWNAGGGWIQSDEDLLRGITAEEARGKALKIAKQYLYRLQQP